MTFQPAAQAFASRAARAPAPQSMIAQLLQETQRTLDTDLDAARAYVARISALLNGFQVEGEPEPANDRRLPAPRGAGLAPWRVKRLEAFIDANLENTITVEGLAQSLRLSCSHLSRACRDTFGVSPHTLVMNRRVERAKSMMLNTREPLSQIAVACGFSDQAHLSRFFRQTMDATPNSWRRTHWVEA